eukprot:TRINITY_DN75898_c0_g1_i1.p1 TRINITY_DN75898_c0_g1~~TRINITY_DN75898_c0_g1_i1.p1  ORF type:complete len:1263 (+),score=280.61 TRINITY_DN75898_c0_g1_i1:395-3790(+)
MAVRNGARIDGKQCSVRHSRPKGERRDAAAGNTSASGQGGVKEISDFLNRHELSANIRAALFGADTKVALRTVRQVEATGGYISERLIHSVLAKVARSALSFELEQRANDWVETLQLDQATKDRVQSVLLGQRPEEIEKLLQEGQNYWFTSQLCRKQNPATWLLSCVKKYRRDEQLDMVSEFCARFNFTADTESKLNELTAERARRLIQNWNPSGGSQHQMQRRFLIELEQALVERRQFEEEKLRSTQMVSAVASHARIMEDWSHQDEDEDIGLDEDYREGLLGNSGSTRSRRARGSDENEVVFDDEDDWFDEDPKATPLQQRGLLASAGNAEHFNIASAGDTATRAVSSSSAAKPAKKKQPTPTHFIMCVDTSGSMLTQDCRGDNGWTMSRRDAVLKTCSNFVTESLMNRDDVYSFVTFNEEAVLHFSCENAINACQQLERLAPLAEKQTLFRMGIKGINSAIKADKKALPPHVVFLSDGEPTDPEAYVKDLGKILRDRPTLKIYTVGFGESAKVNAREGDFAYLQQLASLGRGHFQRCGASLDSLQGAFTAVTSTISRTRGSSRRSTGEREVFHAKATESKQRTSVTATMEETIQEAEEESDSGSDVSHREAPLTGGKGLFDTVEFELPAPDLIFKDTSNSDKWNKFTAARTTFKYDGRNFQRGADVSQVFVRKKPFMKGGMRVVFGMVLESGKDAPRKEGNMMCAKRPFADLQKDHGFKALQAFCMSTAVAQYYAQRFRKATRIAFGKEVQLGFLDCHLYSPVGVGEEGYHFCGEEYLKGHFVKLNSNAGYVNENDYSEHSAVAQAFSHFTYDQSNGELLVVDLQGICGEQDGQAYSLLTDPQVHSREGRAHGESFGSGDLKDEGVSIFFKNHRCGPICQALKLQKDFQLRPPTHLLMVPSIQNCLNVCLKQAAFIRRHRQSRCHSVSVPKHAQEISSRDWMEIRIWATAKNGDKAIELFKEKLEALYADVVQKVAVDPSVRWSAERWQEKLETWRRESKAPIVAFPPDWQRERVREIWVFSDRCDQSGWTEHRNANWASQQIQKELESSRTDEAENASGGNSEQAAQSEWVKRSYNGRAYWLRQSDQHWFWLDDKNKPWQRYLDAENNRYWWWNDDDQSFFFEPEGQ